MPFTVPCATCFDLAGTCSVRVSGRTISLTPNTRRCECSTCGVCAAVCEELPLRCVLPPLERGTYSVTINGRTTSTLRVDDNATTELACSEG